MPAVDVLDEPELERRLAIVQKMDRASSARLIREMASDRRADLLRELPRGSDERRCSRRSTSPSESTLTSLLKYPEGTVGSDNEHRVRRRLSRCDRCRRDGASVNSPRGVTCAGLRGLCHEQTTGTLVRIQLQDLLLADPDAPICFG